MTELDYLAFDADNHYYEALDAFTRHLDPQLGPRCVQWCEINGRKYHVVGGRVSHAVVEPDVRPDRQGRRDARLLPRQPRRHATRSSSSRARADPARVPRPRRRASPSSTSRASRRSGCSRRSACSTRSCSKHDPEARHASRSARSTAGSTRTGASTTRTASSPRRTSRSPTSTGRSSELEWALDHGARIDRACARPRRRTAIGPAARRRPDVRPVLGARATRPASPSSCTRATAATRRNGYALDGFAAGVRAAAAGRRSIKTFAHRAGRSYDFLVTLVVRQAASSGSRTCASRRSRTAPSSSATCSASCASTRPQDARLLHRGPGRDVPAQRVDQPVLGGRRRRGRRAHGRRPGDLRLRLAAHRGHARSRSTTRAELKEFDDADRQRILRDNARFLTELRPG